MYNINACEQCWCQSPTRGSKVYQTPKSNDANVDNVNEGLFNSIRDTNSTIKLKCMC